MKKSNEIGENKKFAKNTVIFTAMTFFQKALGFLLLPIYTSYMTSEQNGIYNLVNSIFALYVLFVSFALDDAVAKRYFDYSDNKESQKKVVGTIVIFALILSVVVTVLLVIFRGILVEPFAKGVPFMPYLALGLLPVLTTSVYSILQKILLIEEKAFTYSVLALVFFLINTGLCIFFVVFKRQAAQGMLMANAITYSCFLILSLFMLRKRLTICFDIREIKYVVKYSSKLLPNRIASWGNSHLNNVIVGNLVNTSILGIYSISLQFQSILVILSNSLIHAIQPWVYKNLKKGTIIGRENIFYGIAFLYAYIGLGLSLFTKDVLAWFFSQSYHDAYKYVPLLVLGALFSATASLLIYVLFYYDDLVIWVSISTVAGVGFDLLVSLILVNKIGAWACAVASVCSAVVRAVIIIWQALKRSGLRLNLLMLVAPIVINYVVAQLICGISFWIKFAVCVVEGLIIVWIFRKQDILLILKDN